jgi:hypothetical protein
MLVYTGATWVDSPIIGDASSTYDTGIGIRFVVSGLTTIQTNLTNHTNANAFTGTTGFVTYTTLGANTAVNSVSGTSILWSSGTSLPFLAGYPNYSGTSNFVLMSAGANTTPQWRNIDTAWRSGLTTTYLAGVTASIQNQVNTISGNSNVLPILSTFSTVGALFYDSTGPQVATYGATGSGNTEWVVSAVTDFVSFVISGVTHGKNGGATPSSGYTDQDDIILFKAPYPIVLKEAWGQTDSGTTVLWNIANCNTAGASCSNMLTSNITSGSTGNFTLTLGSTFTNSDIAKDEWVRLNVIWSGVSSSGVTTNFTGTVFYWKQRQ